MGDHAGAILPFLPLIFFPIFVGFWLLIGFILGVVSGWRGLMERYPDQSERPLLALRGQSATLGMVNFNRTLDIAACPSGLRLHIMKLMAPFQRDLFIPWREITVTERKVLFLRAVELRFGAEPSGRLVLNAKTAALLEGASQGRWPRARLVA